VHPIEPGIGKQDDTWREKCRYYEKDIVVDGRIKRLQSKDLFRTENRKQQTLNKNKTNSSKDSF